MSATVGRAASASIRPLTIPTALMPGKAQPSPSSPSGTRRMLANIRGELGKNTLPTPALIEAVETVSLCLLCSRTAAPVIPQPFWRDSGAAKHRRTHARKHGERSFCAFKSTRPQQPLLPVDPKRVVSGTRYGTDGDDFLADRRKMHRTGVSAAMGSVAPVRTAQLRHAGVHNRIWCSVSD